MFPAVEHRIMKSPHQWDCSVIMHWIAICRIILMIKPIRGANAYINYASHNKDDNYRCETEWEMCRGEVIALPGSIPPIPFLPGLPLFWGFLFPVFSPFLFFHPWHYCRTEFAELQILV